MRELQEVELSDDADDVSDWLNQYLDGLQARGRTYHDIGIIWGALGELSTGLDQTK